jgi:hypothetical protein
LCVHTYACGFARKRARRNALLTAVAATQ